MTLSSIHFWFTDKSLEGSHGKIDHRDVADGESDLTMRVALVALTRTMKNVGTQIQQAMDEREAISVKSVRRSSRISRTTWLSQPVPVVALLVKGSIFKSHVSFHVHTNYVVLLTS